MRDSTGRLGDGSDPIPRRHVLAGAGAATAGLLAGCIGGSTPDGNADGGSTDGGDSSGQGGTSLDSGPVAGETYRLSGLDPVTTTVDVGTEFDISVTVENLSETEQSPSVQLLSDGINYSQSVTLEPGGAKTVTFAAVTSGTLGTGAHVFEISAGEATVEGRVTVE